MRTTLVLLKVTVNDLQSLCSTDVTYFLKLPLFDVYHLIFLQHSCHYNHHYTSLMVGLHAGNLWPRSLPWRQVLLTIPFRIVVFWGRLWMTSGGGGSWKTNPSV